MKMKLGLAFVAAAFAASFTVSSASAYDWSEFQQCMRECRETYRLCLQNSPKPLCDAYHYQCQDACGAYN